MRTALGVVGVILIACAAVFLSIGVGTVFGINAMWVLIGMVGTVVAVAIFVDNFR